MPADTGPAPPQPPKGSSLNFAVIGIGASAGGIQALLRLFESAPHPLGGAVVVILHLSPDHTSHAQEVLQKVTRMKVVQVNKPVPLEKEHVYVIPPGKHISMGDGQLVLSDPEPPRLPPTGIDVFFRSLADAHGARAIAVVLSGTGSDGSMGIGQIRERGGLVLAQPPDEAEYSDMPRNAIATGAVDLVVPVSQIAPKLAQLIANAAEISLPTPADPLDESQDGSAAPPSDLEVLDSILELLRQRTLHDFALYKRGTMIRRVERRMQVTGVQTIGAYREYLTARVEETAPLLADLLIGVTQFFRDPESFASLEKALADNLAQHPEAFEEVRAWVPACATGEEAFSMAIVLDEITRLLPNRPRVTVYASDIDERAIGIARTGNYPSAIENDISPERLAQYFSKQGDRYRVSKTLRDTVVFAAHNILRDPPFSRLDLISCRNLLIYLDRRAQNQVLSSFHFSLRPSGFLFLGAAESADFVSDFFAPLDKHRKIYRTVDDRSRGSTTSFRSVSAPAASVGRSFFSAPPHFDGRTTAGPRQFQEVDLFGPPTIVISGDGRIEHCSANALKIIEDIRGTRVRNLHDVVRADARMRMGQEIEECIRAEKRGEIKALPFETVAGEILVDLLLQPYTNPMRNEKMLFVTCDLLSPMAEASEKEPAGDRGDDLDVLKRALAGSEDRLRSSLQHAQSSTEELRASNEELQAMNEELRSASEELEASREELQSLNEELVTVNSELVAKVQEWARISDDLQNLVSLVGVATIFVDRSLSIKRFTSPAETLFNILPGDRGRPLQHLTHRLLYPEMVADLSSAFESLKTVEREVRSDDGRAFLARVLPYRTDDDRIDGAVLALIDITKQKAAQDLAHLSEEKLRLAAQTSHDFAIIVTDSAGAIVSWNVGATQIFGYTLGEAQGSLIDVIYTENDRRQGIPGQERATAKAHGRAESERWHLNKNGEEVFCSGSMSRIDAGGFLGFAKIVHNETQRKRVDERKDWVLARERADLSESRNQSRLKDEFMAVLSHELKNPLNLINMKAEMLSRLPEARHVDRLQEIANSISRAVMTQGQLIDDLLDLSRLQTGKLSLRQAPIDISKIVRSVAETMQADLQKADIELRVEIADTPILIAGDSVRIEQIVWNLLTNALKFTPADGLVIVRLALVGESAQLDVIDTGLGISQDVLHTVFDMFAQVGEIGQRSRGGLGIGLSLVKQLAELHGGIATVQSEGLGRGSRFTVNLPVDASLADRQGGTAPVDLGLFKGLEVLLVEDSVESRAAMTELLALYGAKVTAAVSAKEALTSAKATPFDVVVTDVTLPDLPDYQIVSALRALPSCAKVPIIAVTGLPLATEESRAREAGCDACLAKPFSLQALAQVLTQIEGRANPT